MKRIYKIKAKLWMWPGDTPWHFVSLDPELSSSIREVFPKSSMVKIEVVLNDYKWNTSLFRNKRDNNYILPIKKEARIKTSVFAGEVLDLTFKI